MKKYDIYITQSSENIIKEFQSYVWKKDRNKQKTNEPIDKLNHAIDAIRYALSHEDKILTAF
jgi:phage terminase large subunit